MSGPLGLGAGVNGSATSGPDGCGATVVATSGCGASARAATGAIRTRPAEANPATVASRRLLFIRCSLTAGGTRRPALSGRRSRPPAGQQLFREEFLDSREEVVLPVQLAFAGPALPHREDVVLHPERVAGTAREPVEPRVAGDLGRV